MQIRREEAKGHTIVRLEGRLDAITSAQLEEEISQLLASKKTKIMIDFCGVDYLSSAGLRVILSATKRVKNSSGRLAIFSIHEEVREIITMAGFDKLIAIYNTEDEAHKSFES
jgi:anti-anti-sigma factor